MNIRTLVFPRARRILKRAEFQDVYASGKKINCVHYGLFVLSVPGEQQRVGMAVSRRIGNAVARNRVKRVLREFFRQMAFSFPGMRIVIVARAGADSLGLKEVRRELAPRLRRLAGLDPEE